MLSPGSCLLLFQICTVSVIPLFEVLHTTERSSVRTAVEVWCCLRIWYTWYMIRQQERGNTAVGVLAKTRKSRTPSRATVPPPLRMYSREKLSKKRNNKTKNNGNNNSNINHRAAAVAAAKTLTATTASTTTTTTTKTTTTTTHCHGLF